jgi:hypothetical protein
LADIPLEGLAVLHPSLEQALFPLAKYDCIVEITLAESQIVIMRAIHVQKGKLFTAHWIEKGVVNRLEHGGFADLSDYLAELFPNFGKHGTYHEYPAMHGLTLGLLGRTVEERQEKRQVENILASTKLPEDASRQLMEDMLNPVRKGTILSLEITSETPQESARDAASKALLLLEGQERSWLFEFSPAADDQEAKMCQVSRKEFVSTLDQIFG